MSCRPIIYCKPIIYSKLLYLPAKSCLLCRIEHVLSGLWLHALGEEIKRQEDKQTWLPWTTATMKKVDIFMPSDDLNTNVHVYITLYV